MAPTVNQEPKSTAKAFPQQAGESLLFHDSSRRAYISDRKVGVLRAGKAGVADGVACPGNRMFGGVFPLCC